MPHRVAVVGGGISGLAFAHRLRSLRPELEILVLESEAAPGGKVRTSHRDGYTVEWGPNGFLTRATDTLDLARDLGLEDELLTADAAAARRYLARDGALRPVPSGPGSFVRSQLLGPAAKARAALEPLLAFRGEGDASVHDFLARHVGRGAADALAEALVLGVTGGDPKRLSVAALFPRLVELEREHRSLVLGMIAARRSARVGRRAGDGTAPERAPEAASSQDPSARGGRLTTLRGGTAQLVHALAASLGDAVRTGLRVRSVAPGPDGLAVAFHQNERAAAGEPTRLSVDVAVLATPAFATADLVAPWAPDAAAELRAIAFAPIRVLALGYDRIDVPRALDGFGFLAPSGEGIRSLGVLWSSTLFPGHAPAGKVLLRALAGGVRDPEMVELDDAEALAAVREDLRRTMGITVEPEFVEQVAWRRGIPQYELGHLERVARIEAALAVRTSPGQPVALLGNSYRGIGLNDCVREARAAAERLAAERFPSSAG